MMQNVEYGAVIILQAIYIHFLSNKITDYVYTAIASIINTPTAKSSWHSIPSLQVWCENYGLPILVTKGTSRL